jgi:hypothetical protein
MLRYFQPEFVTPLTFLCSVFVFFIAFIVTWAILMRVWVSEAQPVQTQAYPSLDLLA